MLEAYKESTPFPNLKVSGRKHYITKECMVEFGNNLEGNTYFFYVSVYFFGTLRILVLFLLHIHTGTVISQSILASESPFMYFSTMAKGFKYTTVRIVHI